jgi:tetratricopeptide (TPR) repeat protein
MIGEIEAHIRTGKWLDARHLAEQFLQVHATHARAYGYLGLTYFRTGEFEKALEPLRKAIVLDDQFWEAGTLLAQSLDRLLRFEEALAIAEQFLAVRPSDQTLLLLREGLKRNVPEKVTDSWQKSTQLDWHHVELTHRD